MSCGLSLSVNTSGQDQNKFVQGYKLLFKRKTGKKGNVKIALIFFYPLEIFKVVFGFHLSIRVSKMGKIRHVFFFILKKTTKNGINDL